MINFEASVQCIICIGWRSLPDQLCTWAEVLVGKVDRRGYDGQQKDATCDVCGRCQTIWSCRWFRLIGYAYELLRCLDVEIWRFLWWWRTDRHTPAHARGVITVLELLIQLLTGLFVTLIHFCSVSTCSVARLVITKIQKSCIKFNMQLLLSPSTKLCIICDSKIRRFWINP